MPILIARYVMKTKLKLLLAVLLCLSLSSCRQSNVDEELLNLHNSIRRTSKLAIDPNLTNFAQNWSDRMQKTRSMKHSNLGFNGQWQMRGENIAMGQTTEKEVFSAWFKSPGHHRNMVNKSFTHVGFGRSGNYWCVCFGQKSK